MSSRVSSSKFRQLLQQAQRDFPAIRFERDILFRWSCEQQTIYYNDSAETPCWTLLHELGHMVHGHDRYLTDRTLLKIEMDAWSAAKMLANAYGFVIDEDHIQDCMDSYRQWQHRRSTCPTCELNGIEVTSGTYRCVNCRETWCVSDNRFCRVYRQLVNI